jgi:crotonobetainyl-CoA:carnitine CoA-transferase CaiB-like acyl-CoA transferase
LTGDRDQAPVPTGLSITDMMAGAQLAQGILALLVRRGVSGRGGRVDVSLIETAIDLQFENLTAYLNGAAEPERSAVAGANVYLAAPYGIYPTADGYLALAMMPVDKLAQQIGCEPLLAYAPDRWFVERDAIKAILRAHLSAKPTRHWLDMLEPAGLWCAPVLQWAELLDHPGFRALKATQSVRAEDGTAMTTTRCPIRVDGHIVTAPRAAPSLGADNAAIDAELAKDQG